MPSVNASSLSKQTEILSVFLDHTFYLFCIFMYFVCTVPFPLLEKQSQAAKAIDTITRFSNVFSTKKKKSYLLKRR